MSTIEIIGGALAMAFGLAILLFYYRQVKLLSAEKPGGVVLFLVALVALFVWGTVQETMVPVVVALVLVILFFAALHRRRRRMIGTGLMTIALIGALLSQQTTYAANGGVEIRTQKVMVKGSHHTSELAIVDTGDETTMAQMIEEAKAEALAELAEQGLEGQIVEVRVEHQEAEAEPAGFQPAAVVPHAVLLPVVVIIIVIIILGFIVIKIIQKCQKFKRKLPDEASPIRPPFIVGHGLVAQTSTNSFSALSTYVPDYEVCTQTWETNDSYFGTFEITGEVTRVGSNLTLSASGSRHFPSSQSVTYGQYAESMQPWGITLNTDETEAPPIGTTYAKNGLPTSTNGLPVQVNGNTVIVRDPLVPGATLRSVLERSQDLVTWTTLLTLDLQEGQKVRIQDDSCPEHAFYRFRTVTP